MQSDWTEKTWNTVWSTLSQNSTPIRWDVTSVRKLFVKFIFLPKFKSEFIWTLDCTDSSGLQSEIWPQDRAHYTMLTNSTFWIQSQFMTPENPHQGDCEIIEDLKINIYIYFQFRNVYTSLKTDIYDMWNHSYLK